MKNFLIKYYHLLLFAIVSLAPFIWFDNNHLLMGPDSLWEFTYTIDTINTYLSSWNTYSGFGHVWQAQSSFLLNCFMYLLSNLVGFGIGFTQKILLTLLIFFCMLFSYKTLLQITDNKIQKHVAVIVAIFYAVNPFALTWIWWRFLWVMFVYILWPIIFLLVDKVFKNNFNKKDFLLLVLSMPLIALGIGPLLMAFILFLALLIYVVLFLFLQNNIALKQVISFLKKLLFIIIVGMLLSLWWLLPGITSLNNSLNHAKTAYDKTLALQYTSQNSTMLNNFRLLGYQPVHASFLGEKFYGESIVKITNNIIFKLVSFIPVLILVVGIFIMTIKKEIFVYKYIGSLYIVFLVGLFLSKGLQYPFREAAYKLIDIPIIGAAFRIPYDKFGYLIVFPMTVLLALFIFTFRKNKYLYKISIILVIVIDLFLVQVFVSPGFLIKNKDRLSAIAVEVPDEYVSLQSMKQLNNSTILVLPFSYGHEYALAWDSGIQPNGNNILSSYIKNSKIIFEPNGNHYNDLLMDFIEMDLFSGAYSKEYINNFLNNIGIDYIFVHNDWKKGFMLNKTKDPEFYKNLFLEDNYKIEKIINNNYFGIYKIKNDRQKLFKITNKAIYSNNPFIGLSRGWNQIVDQKNNSYIYIDDYNNLEITDSGEIYSNDVDTIIDLQMESSPYVENNSFLDVNLWKKNDWECYQKYKDSTVAVKYNDNYSLKLLPQDNNDVCAMAPIKGIDENGILLFQFSYKTTHNNSARVIILQLNDNESEIVFSKRMSSTHDQWNKVVERTVVDAEREYRIFIYSDSGIAPVEYDDFKLALLPFNYKSLLYDNEDNLNVQKTNKYQFELIKSTLNNLVVRIQKVNEGDAFIKFNSSYNDKWVAKIRKNNHKSNALDHFTIDGYANGWYVDVHKYCREQNLCTKNEDGSYDIEMVIEFTPQRWFYLGLLISGTTFVSLIGYLVFDFVKRRKIKNRRGDAKSNTNNNVRNNIKAHTRVGTGIGARSRIATGIVTNKKKK